MKRAVSFLLLAVVLLVGCSSAAPYGQTYSSNEVEPKVVDCQKRGGEPVVIGGAHTNYTVICFAPGTLR